MQALLIAKHYDQIIKEKEFTNDTPLNVATSRGTKDYKEAEQHGRLEGLKMILGIKGKGISHSDQFKMVTEISHKVTRKNKYDRYKEEPFKGTSINKSVEEMKTAIKKFSENCEYLVGECSSSEINEIEALFVYENARIFFRIYCPIDATLKRIDDISGATEYLKNLYIKWVEELKKEVELKK